MFAGVLAAATGLGSIIAAIYMYSTYVLAWDYIPHLVFPVACVFGLCLRHEEGKNIMGPALLAIVLGGLSAAVLAVSAIGSTGFVMEHTAFNARDEKFVLAHYYEILPAAKARYEYLQERKHGRKVELKTTTLTRQERILKEVTIDQ